MEVNLHLSLLVLRAIIFKGCTQFVFSPGARNSPLIRALFFLAEQFKFEIDSHFDERGAAFFALGIAKSSASPVVMITTSGTAVANLFPAVVEAYYSEIPLILITADRPKSVHNLSANQTIEQNHFFKGYIKSDLMISDYVVIDERVEHELTIELNNTLLGLYDGPIHINCPFGEPLISIDLINSFDEDVNKKISKLLKQDVFLSTTGLSKENLREHIIDSTEDSIFKRERDIILGAHIEDKLIQHFFSILKRTVRGFIVVGELEQSINKKSVVEFLELFMEWGWYVVLEINSGLRHFFTGEKQNQVLINYQHFLDHQRILRVLDFDTVIHLGGRLISKSLSNYFRANQQLDYIHINYCKHRYNPEGCVKAHYKYAVDTFSNQILNILQKQYEPWTKRTLVNNTLSFKLKINPWIKKIDIALTNYINGYTFEVFNELEISRILAHHSHKMKLRGEENRLFIGNSMPIRDFNLMGKEPGFIDIYSNRGASGIDGLIATAAGVAKHSYYGFDRTQVKPRFYVLLGDLSALHDLNSIIFCKKNMDSGIPMTIVVINNQEGTIFRYLPIANIINQYPGQKDFYYAHDYDFSGFAKGMGLMYEKANSSLEFLKNLIAYQHNKQSVLLELRVDSNFNQNAHTKFQNDVFNHINYLVDFY